MRWRWAVIAIWAVVGVFAASHAGETVGKLELRGGADEMTEARLADSILTARFSRPVSEFFAVTVQGPMPMTEGMPGQLLDSLIATAKAQPYVRGVLSVRTTKDSSFVAHDGRTTFFLVSLSVQHDSVGPVVQPLRDAFQRVLRRFPDRDAYSVLVTGRAPLDIDIRAVSAEDAQRNERKLIPITLAILVLAFGALVAALLPILVGTMAIAIALTIVGILAAYTPMSVFVLNMISMIGLGVGIDYSLLVVTRFREELNAGLDPAAAAARTFSTAGHAVITSGLTVVVGFAALLLTPLSETKSVGIAGLAVVLVSVLLSTTLLPAMLAILGRSIDKPRWIASRLSLVSPATDLGEVGQVALAASVSCAGARRGCHRAAHAAGRHAQGWTPIAQLVASRDGGRSRCRDTGANGDVRVCAADPSDYRIPAGHGSHRVDRAEGIETAVGHDTFGSASAGHQVTGRPEPRQEPSRVFDSL